MKGILQLNNGHCYQGQWLAANPSTEVKGEMVFYTGMTGYEHVLTDPSYKDKIVVFTYPLIGNYGINEMKFEKEKPQVAAVIVYDTKQTAFHYEAKHTLTDYLEKWGIPMLGRIDTRAIMKKFRQHDSMTACLTNEGQSIEQSKELQKVTQATA